MLVLTRKIGERITLGDEIEIVVVSVRRDQVRLAINAPRHISVYRSELVKQVREENEAAARGAALVRNRGKRRGAEEPGKPKTLACQEIGS